MDSNTSASKLEASFSAGCPPTELKLVATNDSKGIEKVLYSTSIDIMPGVRMRKIPISRIHYILHLMTALTFAFVVHQLIYLDPRPNNVALHGVITFVGAMVWLIDLIPFLACLLARFLSAMVLKKYLGI